MRTILPALVAALISAVAISAPMSAAANDHDARYEHHDRYERDHDGRRDWDHGRDYYDYRGYYHGPRVVIRDEPRVVYREPRVYEAPVYLPTPGVVFHIGLPPIIIPFHH